MAAGNTYVAIATQTLGSAAASVTFSSISGSYTDLVIVYSAKSASSTRDMCMTFNSDTATNYSATILSGNGSTATSIRSTSESFIYLDTNAANNSTIFNAAIVNIQNYSNSTTYKTILCRSNNADLGVDATVGLWRSTAAITSINLTLGGGINLATGSTFSLYGIAAA